MPLDRAVISADKQAAVDESADAGAEMTEEEWNLRVAELNKHQVRVCGLKTHQELMYLEGIAMNAGSLFLDQKAFSSPLAPSSSRGNYCKLLCERAPTVRGTASRGACSSITAGVSSRIINLSL